MNAGLIWTGRRRSAHDSNDRYLACDTVPPNPHAHRRGFVVLVILVAAVAVAGLIGGTLHGLSDMGSAFTSMSSLVEASSWDKFFAGLGRVAALVIVTWLALLLIRRKRRKATAPTKK